MRFRTAAALFPVLLALCAGTVPAWAASPRGRLDGSFGEAGTATVVTPRADGVIEGFAIAPEGRVYVLDGSLLLAFQTDGSVAGDFGEEGHVAIAPAEGRDGEPGDLAVDSRGRVLVVGSTYLPGQKSSEAYVIRLRRDGGRDTNFGSDGEVDTHFRLPAPVGRAEPSVLASSIIVDARNRPVVGGSFGKGSQTCRPFSAGQVPFVGRLAPSGAIDKSFAGSGYVVLKARGGIGSLAAIPAGGSAAFSYLCPSEPRLEAGPPLFSAFDESGKASILEAPLGFSYVAPEIDQSGRVLELESPSPAAEGADALARYLPNGEPDPSFGRKGRVVLRRGGQSVGAFAVDAQDRPIIAVGERRIELRRFRQEGESDTSFGPEGRLIAKAAAPTAIAFDAYGRIYAASLARSSAQSTVEVTRFIGGR